jgi:DNA-binding LytR/AlgR family response regulator
MSNNRYRCLVVDDEPIARKIVATYINQIPQLICVKQCKNAIEAIETLTKDETIDIIFLDINMPHLSGMAMLKILNKQPKVIFTTAYSEFALESYEYNAVDYLLKPFPFERFTKAVFKAIDSIEKSNLIGQQGLSENAKMFIKSNGSNFPIDINDIVYCEAKKNHTKVVLVNEKYYMPLIPLSKFEEDLIAKGFDFLRLHRSYIVAKKEIKEIASDHIIAGHHKIPIGQQYKENFLVQMGIK